jgi:hypothetical protein
VGARQLDDVKGSISDAYSSGGDVLSEFAERQRLARADGHLEESIFTQEVGENLSRNGEWQGTPGNSRWSPKEPEVLAEMLGRYEKAKQLYPDLSLDDFTHLEFKNGYADFSKWVDGGTGPGSHGRTVLSPEQFNPADLDVSGFNKLDAAQKNTLRDKHFKHCNRWLAEKKGWLDKKGLPDINRAKKYLKENRLTWHHVENSTEMQLVPRFLHDHIAHEGGIATAGGLFN